MADHGEGYNTEAIPKDCGVERQIQGLAWLLPLLQCPEQQRAVEALEIDRPVAEPSPEATLPTGRKATVQRDGSLPLVRTHGLAEEQVGNHPAEQHQMTLVTGKAVLTQEASELSMEPGAKILEVLNWCDNPKLSWLPAHPIS